MPENRSQFPTTRWTLILSSGEEKGRREALDWLCERYWHPVYAYVRRKGYDPAAAQDLTQSFLTVFLQRRSIEGADPARGRFRSYMLGALKHFLADFHDRESAERRGGSLAFVECSAATVEGQYLESPTSLSPEMLYERQWALTLIDRASEALRAEQQTGGKSGVFETLKGFLAGEGDYRMAAASLGMNEGAVRVAVHRLRRRYREFLELEIAETVSDPGDVQEEIRHLIAVVAD